MKVAQNRIRAHFLSVSLPLELLRPIVGARSVAQRSKTKQAMKRKRNHAKRGFVTNKKAQLEQNIFCSNCTPSNS